MNEKQARIKLVMTCRTLFQSGLVCATEGNASIRLPDGRILVTPGGFRKDRIELAHPVIVGPDGSNIKGRYPPTSETAAHQALYSRFNCGAVIHAHPLHTLVCVMSGLFDPASPLTPESVLFLNGIAILPYARPSGPATAQALSQLPVNATGAVIDRHGAFIMGGHLDEALCRLEALENTCRLIYLNACAGLKPLPLDKAEIDSLGKLSYTIRET